jgi:nonribosomal peptide synthetase MxcG
MNPRSLRAEAYEARHILVTGVNGYVGTLVVASLLRDTSARIVCLVRAGHELAAMEAAIADEWQSQAGRRWSAAVSQRLSWMTVPADPADLRDLWPGLGHIDEIVHCAG